LPFKQGAFRLAKTTNEPVVMVTASNLHKKVRWNKWNNGIVLIDISAPQPLTEEHSIKEWMGIFNEQMKEKFEQLNEQVDDLEKSR
jgi:1-acyl-sn-glycerol-3-phosphate acyltransferase